MYYTQVVSANITNGELFSIDVRPTIWSYKELNHSKKHCYCQRHGLILPLTKKVDALNTIHMHNLENTTKNSPDLQWQQSTCNSYKNQEH